MNNFTFETTQVKQMLSKSILALALLSSSITFAQQVESPLKSMKGEEIISKRDLFANHYLNENGTFSAAIGTSPINYRKDGSFHPINTSIKNSNNTNYPYANTENLMESHFGATSAHGIQNKIEGKTVSEFLNTKMHWEVNGQLTATVDQSNSTIVVNNNKASYNNIFGEIDAEFKITNGKRKLNFIIPSQNAIANAPVGADYLVFSEEILLPETWKHISTEKGIYIFDEKNNAVLLYESPYSVDGGKRKLREKNTFIDVFASGNRLTILTKVKTSWLLSQARTFPILVDPTVTTYPDEVEMHTGCVYSSDGYKVDSFISFGRDEDFLGQEDFLRGWARFNTTSIPDDATIDAGTTIHFYIEDGSPDYSPANGHSMVISQIPSTINPVTANGTTLYNTINQNGYSPVITTPLNTIGWKNHTITANQIAIDIQNQLAQNYFSVGFMPQGDFFEGEYLIASGWDTDEKPYLVINYTESTMSVGDASKGIGLYPNPVQSELFVKSDYNVESIEVISMLGQSVAKSNGTNSIVVSSLANGIYAVQITLDNGSVVNQKFVKN